MSQIPPNATQGVCAVVLDGDRILLQKRADFRYWSLPGGGIEPGESAEAAAIRETREETGLEVRLTRKVGDYWKPQHNDRVTVFEAERIGGEIVRRSDETLDVRWFEVTALPWMPSTVRRYVDDALAHLPEPVQVTLRISWIEVMLRKFARQGYRLMKLRR
ncbi:MAG: NUDIX domain-containing protein [Chloroflexi bacterium]|nr:NUDIX domain-containing protein [Chloroflexota bacterium]